ncbi:uncharacterized protein [Argopecten irradians]|uniref:uncharacterized protein n=1 Tax=Argopecten irradians TaxID=31199 RepID=UPI003713F7FD
MDEPDSDFEQQPAFPSLEDIQKWKYTKLQEWLVKHKLKKSGVKKVLVNRVFRAMSHSMESDSDEGVNATQNDNLEVLPINKVDSAWKVLNSSDIPPLEMRDVDNYFLYQKNPITGTSLRFERHMKKAKRLCNEGFVRNINYNIISHDTEYCYVKAECLPSMRTSVQVGNLGKSAKHYNLNVCLSKKSGYIIQAFCNCKAGTAGLCAHVGALLYTLVKTKDSCTSNECKWDRPRPIIRKPSPKRVCDISFRKTEKESGNLKTKPYPSIYKAGPCQDDGDLFLSQLLDGLESIYPECVLYKTMRMVQTDISAFLDMYLPPFMYRDSIDIHSEECMVVFRSFLDNISLDSSMSEKVEIATRGQHCNQNWVEARRNLVTASNIADVVKRRTDNPDKLLYRLFGYDSNSKTNRVKSLVHGREFEGQALTEYTAYHLKRCENVEIESRGLYVNPRYPFLGASIDAQVNCSECGTGIVEIKCPYGAADDDLPWRSREPVECARDKNFYCSVVEGSLKLKDSHKYMYQVQGQMAIYELEWADFVIWTKKGISVERISFSETMWRSILPKLTDFYLHAVLPEIFTRRVKRGKPLLNNV